MLEEARRCPDEFYLGIDPVASAMAETSRKAAAKTDRGGAANAMFILASLESLSPELHGIADRLILNYPWGSLLRAVALPDPGLLSKLAAIGTTGARLEVLINMHPLRDALYAARIGLAGAAVTNDEVRLRDGYAQAGLSLRSVDDVTGTRPRATRWGSQLHFAGREICRVRAVKG